MQEIADVAGVGRTTLHRHFPGRRDLMRAITLDALEECEAAIGAARMGEGTAAEVVARLAGGLVPIGERFHFLLYEAELEEDPEIQAADARVTGPVGELVERGRREGTFRPDVPAAWILDAFEALVYAAWEGVHKGRLAPLDAPRLVTGTLLSGLGKTGERSHRGNRT